MAQLTLNWPVGRYRIETELPSPSPPKISTVLSEIGDIEKKWIVREGAAIPTPAHKPDAIYARLAECEPNEAGILSFVNKFGLLCTASAEGGISMASPPVPRIGPIDMLFL